MSTVSSSPLKSQQRFCDEYSETDREALYDLMANPDSDVVRSLFGLMVRPGELTLVRHNEDSGGLYFLTGDPAVESSIGSVKIPGPSNIKHSGNRTQDDIKANGLVVMTLNMAGLAQESEYPRSIAKLPSDTYADRLASVGVQRQANLSKLLETIPDFDIIALSDFPDVDDYLEQLKRVGYMVINTNYMDPGTDRPLSDIETPYSIIQLVNCNRLGVPKSYEINLTPHFQRGNIAGQNGPANWRAYGNEHARSGTPVTDNIYVGSTQHLTLKFENGITATTSTLYINPASDYLGREATIQTSLTNHKHLAEANRGGELNFSIMSGDCNNYGPLGDLGKPVTKAPYVPAFPSTLARTMIPSFAFTGVNLPNLIELLAHHLTSSKLGYRIANLDGPDTKPTWVKGPLKFVLDIVFVPEASKAVVTVLSTSLSDHKMVSTQLLPGEPNSIGADNQTQAVKFQIYVDRLIERRAVAIGGLTALAILVTSGSIHKEIDPNLLSLVPNTTQK